MLSTNCWNFSITQIIPIETSLIVRVCLVSNYVCHVWLLSCLCISIFLFCYLLLSQLKMLRECGGILGLSFNFGLDQVRNSVCKLISIQLENKIPRGRWYIKISLWFPGQLLFVVKLNFRNILEYSRYCGWPRLPWQNSKKIKGGEIQGAQNLKN